MGFGHHGCACAAKRGSVFTHRRCLLRTTTRSRSSSTSAQRIAATWSFYAVDWDTHGRRETITVGGQTANLTSDFSEGAWVTIPINQAANSTLTITVDHTAGANAVLSGVFLN